MEKYRKSLIHRIRKQLEDWLDESHSIFRSEVYRFLHSIKGTAATIGLAEIANTASQLLDEIEHNQREAWEPEDIQLFLMELITYCYGAECDNELKEDDPTPINRENESTILLIDDDISFLNYVKDGLEKQGWHVVATADSEKAITFFYDYNPDCVITDVYLKEKTGFSILSILKHKLTERFVPQIMISMDQDKMIRMKAYEWGADDFITKPFDMDELVIRVKRQLQRKDLVDKLLLADELTGAYNRKYLREFYERQCFELHRFHKNFCLAILDIDHFKKINDHYGHLTGDDVIKSFARYITEHSRKADTVFRYGGEEFVMIFPNTTLAESKVLIKRLLEGFSRITFSGPNDCFFVTFSAGLMEIGDPSISLESSMKIADHALYQAKKSGRNQVKLADPYTCKLSKKKMKAGIVDDDPIIRSILMDILKKIPNMDQIDMEMVPFRNGLELFESGWHQSEGPYLLILDGMMPEMDGNEVLQRVRSLPHHDQFTIMMLTARKNEQDISHALTLGADDYVTKPFHIHTLEARIRRLVQKMKLH